ncbi:MAG: FAD-binding oxidoreductase [Polyangia bacterium]|jgi:alkyldihydroxyacetonephosphate synthase|nr:FAD-binding oxidoreductase [Polyangia bacterium]
MQIRSFSPRSLRSIFKWGAPDVFYTLDERLQSFIRERLDLPEERFQAPFLPGLDQVPKLRPPVLTPLMLRRIEEIVGGDNLAQDDYERARHGSGSTFLDLMRLRQGLVASPPDAVVYPRSEEEVVALVALCHELGVPLVPSGGRSSVTRALEFPGGGLCLDLTRHLNRLLDVDGTDLLARVQPGLYGPAYEASLNDRGFTCGHFPQSFEFSTVGGWLAARGAGQQSTYYGKIEDMLLALRAVTPMGILSTQPFPRAALGPDLNHVFLGSEGALGVITEATLRIWPNRPKSVLPLTFMFKSFEEGLNAIRRILQTGAGRPGVCRLSDPEETEVALTLDGLAGGVVDRGLQRLGYKPGARSLMIAATEGDHAAALQALPRAHAIALRHGGLPLGGKPLRSWYKRRFHDPYLRDDLMDLGVLTDTLETSSTWSNLPRLWRAVRNVIKARPNTVCMTHLSHAYDSGANLYFIVLSPMRLEDPISDYTAFHGSIIDAVVANGGALSHHHGVGRLFAPWFRQHVGPVSFDVFRAIKDHLDPHHIMNPGVFGLTS